MSAVKSSNPPIPGFLQFVTIVECIVVFVAAAGLFFWPGYARDLWAWAVPPFNSRYVGAIYFAALLPLAIAAVSARWSPGRVVHWMILVFTATIGLVMLVHFRNFEWARPATWGFWFLYLFLPLNAVVFLFRLRNLQAASAVPTPLPLAGLFLLLAVALGLHGLGLLIAPQLVSAYWPWPIDAFHGRIYAATFLTPAVGALVMLRRSSSAERLTVGLGLLTLGLLSIVSVVWTSLTVPPAAQVDYRALGTWAFFMLNLLLAFAGLLLLGAAAWRQRA